MIVEKFNSIRAATGMYDSCITNGSYGLRECADSVSSVIDIGANVGFFSVTARILCPDAQVIAVEPEPETYRQLLLNLKHLRVQPLQVGLGPEPIRLHYKDREEHGPFGTRFDHTGTGPDIIPGVSVPQIVNAFGLRPDETFLKVDCEGGERYMLGDSETEEIIRQCVGIGGEYHYLKGGPTRKEFEAWLRSLVEETHDITFYEAFRRGKLCEFRAIRKTRKPKVFFADLEYTTRKVIVLQNFIKGKRGTSKRRVFTKGEQLGLPHDEASHMVCCGQAVYSIVQPQSMQPPSDSDIQDSLESNELETSAK